MRQVLLVAFVVFLTYDASCQKGEADEMSDAAIVVLNTIFSEMSQSANDPLIYHKVFFTELDKRHLGELGYEPGIMDTVIFTQDVFAYIGDNLTRAVNLTDEPGNLRYHSVIHLSPLAQKENGIEYAMCFSSVSYGEQYYAILLIEKMGGEFRYIKRIKESLSFF
ncbi:MAG: hypothetical protein R3330_07365 [Saprospiraceae bacterium]|nr:hypothetical protein [Saprospiraceae bacterium]